MDIELWPCAKVIEATSMSKGQLYAKFKAGKFPAPVRVSENRVAWVRSEVEAWLAETVTHKWTPEGFGAASRKRDRSSGSDTGTQAA